MNNFNINRFEIVQEQDSLLKTDIYLTPLPKYEFKIATDVHYSQILNLGFSPSVELTTRNIFGGAENLSTSFQELSEQLTMLQIQKLILTPMSFLHRLL